MIAQIEACNAFLLEFVLAEPKAHRIFSRGAFDAIVEGAVSSAFGLLDDLWRVSLYHCRRGVAGN